METSRKHPVMALWVQSAKPLYSQKMSRLEIITLGEFLCCPYYYQRVVSGHSLATASLDLLDLLITTSHVVFTLKDIS